jgi:hypothetical protein
MGQGITHYINHVSPEYKYGFTLDNMNISQLHGTQSGQNQCLLEFEVHCEVDGDFTIPRGYYTGAIIDIALRNADGTPCEFDLIRVDQAQFGNIVTGQQAPVGPESEEVTAHSTNGRIRAPEIMMSNGSVLAIDVCEGVIGERLAHYTDLEPYLQERRFGKHAIVRCTEQIPGVKRLTLRSYNIGVECDGIYCVRFV